MRRLVILSTLVLVLVVLTAWLVMPMFVEPRESTLDECRGCPSLLTFVPDEARKVVVVPRGGSTLFELGRRLDPGIDLRDLLPAPGLLAVGLGGAPLVAWQDEQGHWGAAAAPVGLRRILLRIATYKYGGPTVRWVGSTILLGPASLSGDLRALDELKRLGSVPAHFFALHDSPEGRSFGRLTPRSLEITTFPSGDEMRTARTAQHPPDAVLSLAVSDVGALVAPIDEILPVKTASLRGQPGQLVLYSVDSAGLLPRPRGVLLLEGDRDARDAIEQTVPRVKGATLDSSRRIENVEVFRRETLGLIVETASSDGRLVIALDGSSMDRWLRERLDPDPEAAVWSFSGDPSAIVEIVDALARSPGRYLLGSSSRKAIRRFGDVVRPFRTASRVDSRLTRTPDGPVIESRVDW
jgi:hypothetical protein